MNRTIDFFIIGAQKAGTTSLHRYLQQHPDIFMPYQKEIQYFVRDSDYREGDGHLDFYYKEVEGEYLLGLSHVELLYCDRAPERLFTYNSQAKLIAILRNPIDRAYSAFWYMRSNGREKAPTFEEALERERAGGFVGDDDLADFTYLEHGHYAEQIKRFIRFFGRDQLYVLLSEDLRESAEVWGGLFSWLGVDPGLINLRDAPKYNVAGVPKYMWLQRLVKAPDSMFKRAYRRAVPRALRYLITRHLTDRLIDRNLRSSRYPPMDPATRARLCDYYSCRNRELAELIGRDISHWQ